MGKFFGEAMEIHIEMIDVLDISAPSEGMDCKWSLVNKNNSCKLFIVNVQTYSKSVDVTSTSITRVVLENSLEKPSGIRWQFIKTNE